MRQKTRILIYILIAAATVIIGTLAILENHRADVPVSAQGHIDLGRIYLTELSYEKASLEFTEAIEVEPLNADAYLGLAETYIGMGDTEKAIEVLEEGYDKTGDERLKNMLKKLLPPEETTVTTVITTEETTTVSTVAMAVVPDLSGLTEEEAIVACEAVGLKYSVSYDYSDEVEKGYVIGQTIPVNASVADGISLPFTVSKGIEVMTTVAATTAPAEDFITIRGQQYSTSLTELYLVNMSLNDKDIKDLDKMVNLTKLNLAINYISDISPLKNLTNLTDLSLDSNNIIDITSLKDLTNLKHLDLSDNQINNLNPLNNLSNLETLLLIENQISDISSLKGLNKLWLLNLGGNKIIDIGSLKSLTNLTTLILWNNQIDDISALKNLTNLTILQLWNNRIKDVSILKHLINLETLDLSNYTNDTCPIKRIYELKNLEFNNNQIDAEDIKELQKALPNCKIKS